MRIITGIAAPWDTPSTHPGRPFQLDAAGAYAIDPAGDLVLEHETSPHVIGRATDIQVTELRGILVTAEVDDDDLDLDLYAFSIEIAPWEMTLIDGVHVLTAGTIGHVALTRHPAFPGTDIEVVG